MFDKIIIFIEDTLYFLKRINWPVIVMVSCCLLMWAIIIYSVWSRL